MVRELPAGQPVLPVVSGPDLPRVRLRVRHRGLLAAPRQRHEPGVALLEQGPGAGLAPLETEPQIGGQGHREVDPVGGRPALVVAVLGVGPARRLPAVVEDRLAVHHHLHLAGDAPDRPQQDVLGVVVVGGPAVGLRAALLVPPGPHQQRVADDDPAGRRPPAGLHDHRAREVADVGGHLHVHRGDPEGPRVRTEHPPEHAARVEPRDAHPVDRAARSEQGAHLAVAQEPVVPDGHRASPVGRTRMLVVDRLAARHGGNIVSVRYRAQEANWNVRVTIDAARVARATRDGRPWGRTR